MAGGALSSESDDTKIEGTHRPSIASAINAGTNKGDGSSDDESSEDESLFEMGRDR